MAKKRLVLLFTVLAMIFLQTTISLASPMDIKNHWAKDEILYLLDKGLASGYDDGSFRPENNITRAEFIKIVNNVYGFEDLARIGFSDVKKEDWFYTHIRKAVAAGYINGYGDGTIKPNNPITRQEVAKILALASQLEGDGSSLKFKDKEKIGYWALDYVAALVSHGYIEGYTDGSFGPTQNISRGEVAKLLSSIHKDLKGNQDNNVEEPQDTAWKQFIQLVNRVPEAPKITSIVADEKVTIEQARNIYNLLNPREKEYIPKAVIDKFKAVEAKIESLKTPIMGKNKVDMRQAQAWAIKRGAHKRFIDVAEYYWYYGDLTGIKPEILYAQAAKETNFGKYTGSVKPEMNNWAGIKIYNPKGDSTYDHEIFDTPKDGVRAHFNHMGIYCGVDPIGTPHPRWYRTSTASWAGSIKYVEDLGGKWAPNLDYGISIIRDYVKSIYTTRVPREEDLEVALEFSKKVEVVDKNNMEEVKGIIEIYDSLTEVERELIPYNIRETVISLKGTRGS